MPDRFDKHNEGLQSPASRGVVITPNDGADLATNSRAIWIGGAGNLTVLLAGDTASVLISSIPAGTLLPIRAKRIYSTGTTATLIVALS